mmetsp:Transcript_64286/g.114209  ORF Transcript_64286/g.114209 Transcript_64286/m.114209 type:complete len:314 (+) Transcript_64286:52-993(+)
MWWLQLAWTLLIFRLSFIFSYVAAQVPPKTLADGQVFPSLGLGVYMMEPGQETYNSVKWALELGYRMVDTAQMYGNEASVGEAVRDSGIPRSELWIQSKLNSQNHGYKKTINSVKASIKSMGLDYLDCFLVHSPYGGKLVETWDALLKLQKDGLLRSIGVSNYGLQHLKVLSDHQRPLPVMNQIEMHPMILAERQALIDYCNQKHIVVQAYGSLFFGRTEFLSDQHVTAIVANHGGKSAAQVLLRWGYQKGFQLIPKSVKRNRIESNMDIFDFELTETEMKSLDGMQGFLGAYWNPVDDAAVDLGATHHAGEL